MLLAGMSLAQADELFPPQILAPADGTTLNSANLNIIYQTFNRALVTAKFNITDEYDFAFYRGYKFEQAITDISQEAYAVLPSLKLPDGNYILRMYFEDEVVTSPSTNAVRFTIDNTPPRFAALLPGKDDCFKPGSVVYIEAKVFNVQKDISAEASAQVMIDGALLGETLSFDPEEGKIYGFITLPDELFDGLHQGMILLSDQSGNEGKEIFSININHALTQTANPYALDPTATTMNYSGITLEAIISKLNYGPNPFSPAQALPGAFAAQGRGMIFDYSLAQPANLKIMIYDLAGMLIWKKELANESSGAIAWDGIDQFGQPAKNGVYLYIFTATVNGISEVQRGKIIIMR